MYLSISFSFFLVPSDFFLFFFYISQDEDIQYPGSLAAIGFGDGRVAVINTLSGGTLFSMSSENVSSPDDNVDNDTAMNDIFFTSDNRAIVGRSGTSIVVWVLPDGQEKCRIPSKEATSMCHAGRHADDVGDLVLVGNARGYVSMWHLPLSLSNDKNNNSNDNNNTNNNGNITLVSESYQGESVPITSTASSLDCTYCLSGNASGTLISWRSERGGSLERHAVLKTKWPKNAPVTQCCFRPDGQRVAACSIDSPMVHVWDVHGAPSSGIIWAGTGSGIGEGVTSVSWSDDGRAIVTLSAKGTDVLVWDSESRTRLTRMEGSHRNVRCIGFVYVPTGPDTVMCSLVTGGDDCILRFWNFSGMVPGAPGKRTFEIDDRNSIQQMVGSHGNIVDGRKEKGSEVVVDKDMDGLDNLQIHNAKRKRAALNGHDGSVTCVAKCGRNMVVTGGVDGTVRIWSIQEGEHLGTLSGTGGEIVAVSFQFGCFCFLMPNFVSLFLYLCLTFNCVFSFFPFTGCLF